MYWLFWCLVPAILAVSSFDDYNYIYIASSSSISMSRDGSVYSTIDNGINYFRKINNTYTLISKFYPLCTSTGLSCSATKQVMTYDGSRILAYSTNDNFVRVYKIVNDTISHSQQIAATGPMQSRFQVKEDYLLLSSTTSMQYYLYDHVSGLYQLIYSGNYPATQSGATFSTDGKYVLTYSSTLQSYIYYYDGTTFNVPATSTQIPLVNGTITQIHDFKVEQFNSTTYFIFICFTASLTGTNRQLHYYTFDAGGINIGQQIDQTTYYLYYIYSTKNAKYIAQGVTPFSLKFYEFDTATGQYVLVFQSYNFVGTYPSNIYITEDGSFLYGSTTGGNTAFYFKCTLPYCSKCLSLNQCLQCNNTFTLSSSQTCACNSTQTLLNSSCVNCNITKCSSCSANNTCSGCTQGYSLVSNACICPSGSTISYLDGSCVSCNVNSCSRCDQANVCALYDSKQTKDMQQIKDRLNNDEKIIVGLLVVVLILIVFGIVYFLIKAKQIMQSMPKVGSEQGVFAQQQNPTDKADTIAVDNGQPSFQINEQTFDTIADLQVNKPKVRRKNKRNYDEPKLQNISLQKFMEKGEI